MNKVISIIFGVSEKVNYLPIVSRVLAILALSVSLVNEVDSQNWMTLLTFLFLTIVAFDIVKVHLKIIDKR